MGTLRRLGAHLMIGVPEELLARAARAPEVRARVVDDRDLEALGHALPRDGDVHVHAVLLPVAVGVELGLHPEVKLLPVLAVLEGLDHLRLPVLEAGLGGVLAGGEGAREGEYCDGSEGPEGSVHGG